MDALELCKSAKVRSRSAAHDAAEQVTMTQVLKAVQSTREATLCGLIACLAVGMLVVVAHIVQETYNYDQIFEKYRADLRDRVETVQQDLPVWGDPGHLSLGQGRKSLLRPEDSCRQE